MKTTTIKLMPGLLMLFAAIVLMSGAAFVAHPMTASSYVLSALAVIFLCLGTLLLLHSRKQK